MGMMPAPNACFITGLKTENFPSSWDVIEYIIDVKQKRLMFKFDSYHQNSEFVEKNKYILQGLILNEKFPTEFYKVDAPILDNHKLEAIINEAIIPRTPKERIDNLLIYLHSLQEFEGSIIKFPNNESKNDLAKRLYFRNYNEMVFYLFTLWNDGYIKGVDASTKDGTDIISIQLTYYGLAKVIEINESGVNSERCFVALSFSEEVKSIRESIKNAITESGYKPILIDEIHFDSDVTINDALIAEIKKSKFVVADFTQHKHGVYFEAGFALGLKKPVLYLCHKDDFNKSHFDTNHYPHIIYSNLDELVEKLKTKIEAWIN